VGRQIRRYLAGGDNLDFHAVHLLYAANKWEKASEILRNLDRGRTVIINRYTPSNLAYGVAHGLPLKWLASLEQDLPQPDIVIILDVSPKTSFKRKERRRDVHEGNRSYLNKVRSVYRRLARRHRWQILNGQRGSRVVHSDVWNRVSPLLGRTNRES
jgi:dTMP kinase